MYKLFLSLALIGICSCSANKPQTMQSVISQLHDIWALQKMEGEPLGEGQFSSQPSIEFHINDKRVIGNDGCNDFMGSILEVSQTQISLGPLGGTKKLCEKMEGTNRFLGLMASVDRYKREGMILTLSDKKGQTLLTFLKVD